MPAKTNELVLAISTHRGHRGMPKVTYFRERRDSSTGAIVSEARALARASGSAQQCVISHVALPDGRASDTLDWQCPETLAR